MAKPGRLILVIHDKYHAAKGLASDGDFRLTGGFAQRACRLIDCIMHSDTSVECERQGTIETEEMRIEWTFEVRL